MPICADPSSRASDAANQLLISEQLMMLVSLVWMTRLYWVIAADDGRLLLSHDVSTMPEHFARFIQTRSSPGLILISQELSYHHAIEGLLRLWTTTEAEDCHNILSFLPR
jgi:hypothetical protein